LKSSNRIGVSATTDALRALPSMSDSSPKKSPGPKVATSRPRTRQLALPETTTNNSAEYKVIFSVA